jgi:hypothetical protein
MHIWFLHGYAGSGKDTTADLMKVLLGPSVHISSFASAVKDEVAQLYGLERPLLDTQEGKQSYVGNKTVRDLLIEHAESAKQTSGNPAIWASRIMPPPPETLHWIFSDWRFMSELTTIRERFPDADIHTVRIVRPSVKPMTSHTEHELDEYPCKYVMENSGSRLFLANQVADMIEYICC